MFFEGIREVGKFFGRVRAGEQVEADGRRPTRLGQVGEHIVEKRNRERAQIVFVDDLKPASVTSVAVSSRDFRKLVSSVSAHGTG